MLVYFNAAIRMENLKMLKKQLNNWSDILISKTACWENYDQDDMIDRSLLETP